MHVPAKVKAQVEEAVRKYIAIANTTYKPAVPFKMPHIRYDLRGRVGGWAKPSLWEMNFNSILLMENLEDYLARTVPHEVAHLIDHAVYGNTYRGNKRSVHGWEWKSVMRVFGADASRCHSYDTTNAQVRNKAKYHYVCSGCKQDFFLGPVRHNKINRGAQYWCTSCGRVHGKLVYQVPVGKVTYTEAREKVAAQTQMKDTPVASGSKKERALAFYRENKDVNVFINFCMHKLDMTRAGATTYFYMCRKEA